MLTSEGHRFHVDVVQDLEVVGDESDRAHQALAHARSRQRLEQVRTEPRLAGVAGGLESELPLRELRSRGREPAALQEPPAVAIARNPDARPPAVGFKKNPLFLEPPDRLRDAPPPPRARP